MDTKKEQKKLYDILDGPNKDSLFDACKYAYNSNVGIAVHFTVAVGYTLPKDNPNSAYIPMSISDIRIIGITHEDGSGESFLLYGYCNADLNSFAKNFNNTKPYSFEAYFDARSRKGWISFTA